ncbi:DoxX family protein [Streptomyces tirandamycinicus]|uniref:DoxX family protein n=1 Tax=Streptomyces TaxID=1883 RepID=UPI00036D0110|nr:MULTISPECIES: DoxX family protein [Streptomyces]MCY0979890.1 DoxX family protein [Streptomyces tirandamycinicus]NNJ02803.1 DoxX family protein [Streptomyces sp. PKU-MA01144]
MKLPTGRVRHSEGPDGGTAPVAVGAADAGVLLLRLAVGLVLAGHGAQKLFGWFDGPGLDAAGRGFSQLGWDPGVVFAGLAGVAELLGGLGLAVGLLTPLSAAACVGVMVDAMAVAPVIDLWSAAGTAFVYPMVLAVGALTVAAVGPLRLSLDARFPWRDGGWVPAGVALVLGLVGAFVVLALR